MGIKFFRTVLHSNYDWKLVGCCCSENSLATIQNMPDLYRPLVCLATCLRQNALETEEWPLPVFYFFFSALCVLYYNYNFLLNMTINNISASSYEGFILEYSLEFVRDISIKPS